MWCSLSRHVWTLLCCLLLTCWIRASRHTRIKRNTIIGSYPLCPLGCASCSSLNGCVTCRPGLYLYLERTGARETGHCVHVCPSGHYPHNKKHFAICRKCAQPYCDTCNAKACVACQPDYYIHAGQCEPCTSHSSCNHSEECMLGDWSEWSVCKKNGQTCGYKYGSQYRNRELLHTARYPTPQCDVSPPHETRRCRLLFRYCSDILTNNSEPPRRCVPSDHKCWRRRLRRLRKRNRCRKNSRDRQDRRSKAKRKRGKCGSKKKKKKSQEQKESSTKSKKPHAKHMFYPNLKTNQIDDLVNVR